MSSLAREEFDSACALQTAQSNARRIRQGVDSAQQSPSRASVRWPFELMQNSHDAGPRDGDERVDVHFTLRDDRLVVSHTGKSFLARELAALLYGGSSKELDSEETTGRFGTGFLVTHAVSPQVEVAGVLSTQEGSEAFNIRLSRAGDVDSIVANIELAQASLDSAVSVDDTWLSDNPTASFTYHTPNTAIVRRGLRRLEQALPYLYATCGKLGRVKIDCLHQMLSLEPTHTHSWNHDDFIITHTEVTLETSSGHTHYTAVRIARLTGRSALIVVLESSSLGAHQVVCPTDTFPRIFVTFPIAGTDALPLNVVVDGHFAPRPERDGIAMNDADRTLLDDALSALPSLLQHALESGWCDAQELGALVVPSRPLGGESDSIELEWWKGTLARVAREAATTPIVRTTAGLLPALPAGDAPTASFLVPAIRAAASECVDYDTFHSLGSDLAGLNLPSREIAESWGKIAGHWSRLGLPVQRLGLKELTDWLKTHGDALADLPIDEDRFSWLGRLLQMASKLRDQNVRNWVNGLLPNQNGFLTHTTKHALYKDGGVSSEIKDIALAIGVDLRSQLLHPALAEALRTSDYAPVNDLATELLDSLVGDELTQARALDMVIERLVQRLPDEGPFDEDSGLTALHASARLIEYLAERGDVHCIRKCPLLTAGERILHLSPNQQMLAPSLHWPPSQRPYMGLYTENRLLADRYCVDDGLTGALDKLIVLGLVVGAPLFRGPRRELTDVNLLREMSIGEEDPTGVTVRNSTFGQIAFLATDLVQRCGQDPQLAKLLLEFVLTVAAREDQSWRESETVSAVRSGEQIHLALRRALWPFELKVRSWIPIKPPDADGIAPMPASESCLREILDSCWLRGNRDAVDLLHQVFGFRQLTLMLDSLDAQIESDLVELLQDPELVRAAAASPEAVRFANELTTREVPLESMRELVQDLEEDKALGEHLLHRREHRRRVQANRSLGAIVERLVRESLEQAGFSVCDTGVGSDFRIAAEVGSAANLRLTRGKERWLVEVKATRGQLVRMTSTQAREAVAKPDRFLLCIVPIDPQQSCPDRDHVRARMRFVADIGVRVSELCNDLGEFEELRADITADISLGVRLEITPGPACVLVSSPVWESDGFPLEDLARRLAGD